MGKFLERTNVMNYNNPYSINPYGYPYYFPTTPQYYGNVYPEIQQQRNVTPHSVVHEVLGPIRPEEIIQEDVTCVGGKTGEELGSETWNFEIFKVKYEAYECQIQVVASVLGFREQRWTIKRGQSDFEWKLEISPLAAGVGIPPGTHKIVGWMVGKGLWMRYEYRLGGKVQARIDPFLVATFPQLRFTI